ncbi:unnamed protein product [Leptosia nina]|uniref:Uncharacterized protein n=1 Tax=Leptosia nina TaxID=320188 RepID=A0AAV1JE06_9NEOP
MEEDLRKQVEDRPYRQLQALSKSLQLPCNFKKKYQVELIIARKSGREDKVKEIIESVMKERHHKKTQKKVLAEYKPIRKRALSPPIGTTPKQAKNVCGQIEKADIRRSLIDKFNENEPKNMMCLRSSSSKTLRQYNTKEIVGANNDTLLRRHSIQRRLSATSIILRNNNINSFLNKQASSQTSQQMRESNRCELLRITPKIPKNIEKATVHFLNDDGTLSPIKAFIQNPLLSNPTSKEKDLLDLLNGIDIADVLGTDDNQLCCPNVSDDSAYYGDGESPLQLDRNTNDVEILAIEGSNGMSNTTDVNTESVNNDILNLPRISEPFTNLNTALDVAQGMYDVTQGCSKEKRSNVAHPYQVVRVVEGSQYVLDCCYNLKDSYVQSTHTPPSKLASTKSVYSSTTIVSATEHATSAEMVHNAYSTEEEQLQNYAQHLQYFQETPKAVQASNHIDLVSDEPVFEIDEALEFINEDGNLEKFNCFLCDWAGPDVLFDYHIYTEHPHNIQRPEKTDWNITFTLGNLVEKSLWCNQVIDYDNNMYILSVKYEDPDCLMATLSSPSAVQIQKTASITVYNKVTGEPHNWLGEIKPTPPYLPYSNNLSCLKLSLSKLNLLPNSANLKLINRELVCETTNKIVVGQPELDDVHIILFVRLLT